VSAALTRRFGLAGGLAWVGILTFGVVAEQTKTRLEVANETKNTKEATDAKEVVLGNGLRVLDLKVGGGQRPFNGALVLLNYRGIVRDTGEVFEDTFARGKPIVYSYGSRPFTGGLCKGVELGLADMRNGGRRKIIVPPDLGFGTEGFALQGTRHVEDKKGRIPPNATLEYEVELLRVSIAPS